MDSEELEFGLKARGFVGISEMDSCGRCHLNESHYVLRTDGLIIYSNWPHWNTEHPKCVNESWGQLDEFTFEKLDATMKAVDELKI